jgi:ATP-binding cassette subfamily B protein
MRKSILVKQHDIRDCGICCLESIIKHYGGYIPLETLRLETKTNKLGTSAYNIIKTAKKIGFDATGLKLKNIKTEHIILPAIAHIVTEKGLNHFVVIYKINKDKIYIMDPAKGFIKESLKDFNKKWTNIILIFKPYKKIPFNDNNKIFNQIFLKLIKNNKKSIIKILLINIFLTAISIISSYFLKIAISNIEDTYITSIILIISIFGIISFYKVLLNFIKNELSIYLNKNIDCTIIPDFIDHIFNLPSNVITSRSSGEILTRINELKNIKELFSEILISLLLNITLCISSIFFLIELNNKLFLILCLIAIIYVLISVITNNLIVERINNCLDTEAVFNSYLVENISSIESIKNLNIINYQKNSLFKEYTEYIKSIFEYNKTLNYIYLFKNMINEIGTFTITSVGILFILNNKLDLLSLITFNSLLSYFIDPIESSINELPKINRIKLSVEKIKDLINIEEENNKESIFQNGDIEIKNLSYSYNDCDNIIENISLNIKEKDRIEIKGESGSGKSTICKILNRSLNDYKGSIRINDINIKDYPLKTIRKNIVYVSQREKLFTDTIRNNIILDSNINLNELNKIIKITKVNNIIDNKGLRLDSLLYDEGFNLSGGERQRIIIARSIVKKPKILIIDEALSEVEPMLAKEIMDGICEYLSSSTIIYISHSNETIFNNIKYIKEKNA